jgi:DNA helicase MCM8
MAPALLSRFDLIFIILDRPDARHDQMLSNHIMNSYQQNDLGPFATAAVLSRRVGVGVDEPGPDDLEEDMRSLSQRLRAGVKECPAAKLLKYEDLRKYISYARTYCHPRLSNSAAKVLQELYMRMRSEASSDTTPITTRQLESLIRLSQAWARAELREEVTAVDAKAVVDLMQESMLDASCDEFGAIDFGMGRPSGSARRRNGKRAQVSMSYW